MEKLNKYFSAAALSVALYLLLSLNAQAQHQSNNGGGGGGGGHASSPAPAPAPAPAPRMQSAPAPRTQSVPSPSRSYSPSNNYARPTYNNNTHAPVRTYNNNANGNYPRQGITQRPYYSGHGNASSGAGGVNSYRTNQGSVYGRNHVGYVAGGGRGYLPGNTYYHYNRGYYSSYYYPQLGISIGYLPYGYYPFYWDNYQYFYSDGLFYQYNNDQYTVVEPPVGAEVKSLPANAQSIVINGQQYYEVNGVYYEPITKDDGTLSYQVAGKDGELNTDQSQNVDNGPPPPQIGDIVPTLPPNCRKINVNGEKLYLSEDGVYYKVIVDDNGNKSYKIVGLPADDDQQQTPPQQN
jgi:hypothetical protein